MIAHLTPAELKALMRGETSKRRVKRVLAHLFRGCKECFAVVVPELSRAFGTGPAEVPPETLEAGSHSAEQALAREFWYVCYLQEEREKVSQAAEMLEREGIDAVFFPQPGLSGLALYEALLAKSWVLRREEPLEMVAYARGAVLVAETLKRKRLGERRWFDLQARAWGELANAYRAADKLDQAGVSFDQTFELFRQGTGDETLEVRLHDLQASYYGTRRWFKLALKSLDAVHAIHVRKGDSHLAGRALVKKALYTIYSGEPESALPLLDKALAMIDEARDPQLVCDAIQNRLLALVESRRFPEARKLLFVNAARFRDLAGGINRLKIEWKKARIHAGLGSLTSAEEIFLDVRRGFGAAGMGFHTALISLELSVIRMRQGRTEDARQEATAAGEVFRKLNVHRELLVAVGVAQRCFEIGAATVPLLESLVEYARRAEHEPGLPFEPRF